MPTERLSSFTEACSQAQDGGTLWELFRDYMAERGVLRLSYHLVGWSGQSDQMRVIAEGFPEDWVRHYVDRSFFSIDPITALAARRTQPFFWGDIGKLTTLSNSEKRFLRELETADLGDGLAMQVYGPNMRNGYVGLGFGPSRPDLSRYQIFELKSAAQIAHLRHCEMSDEDTALQRDLSPREREILTWIARGKSNAVIAQMLGVSRHTVDTNVRRLFEKLEVNDRVNAVLRGLRSGVLLMDRR